MEASIPMSRKTRRTLLWIYGTALAYFVLKQCYYAVFTGGFPDQLAHLSYMIQMVKEPSLLPDFASMCIWQETGVSGGMTLMAPAAGTANYLTHPSLYYLIMAAIGGVRILPDGTAALSLLRLRALNILLSSVTVTLAFRLGYTRLRGRSPWVHALYAAAVATLPMLAYVGAGVNNDNLAFLAMVIFTTGLLRYQEDRTDLKTYLLIGLGFLTGSLSKLTTALIFVLILAAVLITSIIRTRSLKLVANRYFLITLPCYLLFLAYELFIHARYGTWQPSLLNINPEYFYKSVYYVPPENRVPMTVLQYARHFFGGIGYTWSSLYGHNAAVTALMNNRMWGLVYWIVPAAAGIVMLRGWARRTDDRITAPVVFSFAGTLAYHFYSNWKGYPVSGYMEGAQARYYLALIVPLALTVCLRGPTPPPRRRWICRILAVLLIAAWIAGDGIRLVFLYGFPSA